MPATEKTPAAAAAIAAILPPEPDRVRVALAALARLYHDPVNAYDPAYAAWVQRVADLASAAGVAVNIVTVNLTTERTTVTTYGPTTP